MTKLQGTEKQIKWAEQIREDLIKSVRHIIETTDKKYKRIVLEQLNASEKDVENTIAFLENIENAKDIIDIRFKDAKELISENITIEIDETLIEQIKEDEKIMKRISKIESKEDKEVYIERTAQIIEMNLNISFEKAIKAIEKLR